VNLLGQLEATAKVTEAVKPQLAAVKNDMERELQKVGSLIERLKQKLEFETQKREKAIKAEQDMRHAQIELEIVNRQSNISDLYDTIYEKQEEVYKELGGFTEIKFYNFFSNFASDNIDFSVILMRLFNVFVFSLCIVFSYLYLRQDIFIGTMFSFMTVGLPLGIYLATSISTSSWVILGAIFFVPFLIEIFNNLT
jgi:hypothetical protein